MTRGVRKPLVSSVVLVALIAVAGCSHYLLAEREPWRHEAEVACLESGAVPETPARIRISAINGPGVCGMDYPLKISALGESAPLGYTDEPVRPPSPIPEAAPQQWPIIQSSTLPPPHAAAPQDLPPQDVPQNGQPYSGSPQYVAPQAGAPLSLAPPGLPPPDADESDIQAGPPHPYYNAPPLAEQGREGVAAAGPVELKPPATLACPIVSALDQWVSGAVQPAAMRWFRQPVVEIKQISAYSCRGMNGNPNAHISEHAFGNALDIAEFDLADGRRISVQYGWHGTPEEQGFLRDVQAAACREFTTVLAPGANVYHYNHIHVDLMRRASRSYICEPAPISGEVAAARARARYAAQHGDPRFTGSIKAKLNRPAFGNSSEDDDSLPLAVPGED